MQFGAFLIVELWAAPDGGKANDPAIPTVLADFQGLLLPTRHKMTRTVEALEKRLKRIKVLKHGVQVKVERELGKLIHPNLPPLLSAERSPRAELLVLGSFDSAGVPQGEYHRRVSAVDQFTAAQHEPGAAAGLF